MPIEIRANTGGVPMRYACSHNQEADCSGIAAQNLIKLIKLCAYETGRRIVVNAGAFSASPTHN
jgi:hypothetical protein